MIRSALVVVLVLTVSLTAQSGWPPVMLPAVGVAVTPLGPASAVSGVVALGFSTSLDVTAVQAFVDGEPAGPLVVGHASSTPVSLGFSTTWDTTFYPDGLHLLTARSYVAAGRFEPLEELATSTPVLVRIANRPLPASVGWGGPGDVPLVGDFDGDGVSDPTVVRVIGGALYWFVNGSDVGWRWYQHGSDGDVPLAGDFDGDGRAEMAAYHDGAWLLRRAD